MPLRAADAAAGPLGARIAFAAIVTVPLVVRRRAPVPVVVVLAAATVVWARHASTPESGTLPFPSLLLAAFSVACYARQPFAAVAGGLTLYAAMLLAIESNYYQGGPAGAANVAILTFFFGGAWTAGWLVRRRAAQARRAVAESGELARVAVGEERTRIARELHDVVAHSVSTIAVQAGAAEEQIDRDPERAREHIAAVRRTAREAMSEMRRVLEVLRTDEPRYAPQPGLSRLSDLVDEARGAGLPVELVEDGERPELPPGLDLVAFRVVQESLTNVQKRAPGAPTCVLVRYGAESLELEIANTPISGVQVNGGGSGHGLIGMRERVNLFGGRFTAGEDDGGGFRVHARLPLAEEPR